MTNEDRYQQLFDSYCTLTEHRRRNDPTFTIDELRGLLASAYEFEGQDWAGRGEPKNTGIAARIAAFEHVLAQWERRLDEENTHE